MMVFLLHVGRLLLTTSRIVIRNRILCEVALRVYQIWPSRCHWVLSKRYL